MPPQNPNKQLKLEYSSQYTNKGNKNIEVQLQYILSRVTNETILKFWVFFFLPLLLVPHKISHRINKTIHNHELIQLGIFVVEAMMSYERDDKKTKVLYNLLQLHHKSWVH